MTDNEWFENIYLKNYAALKKTAYYLICKRFCVQDWTWAEDIVQDAFSILYSGIGKKNLREHPNIHGWLIVTLKQVVCSNFQRAYHYLEVQLDEANNVSVGNSYDQLAEDFFPPELSQEERCILYLAFVEEYSHEEIAAYFHLTSAAASRKRLSRAKEHYKKLKKLENSDVFRLQSTTPVEYTQKRGEKNV